MPLSTPTWASVSELGLGKHAVAAGQDEPVSLPGLATPGIFLVSLTLSGPGLDLFHMDPLISRAVCILSALAILLSGWQFPHLYIGEMQAQRFNMAV